MNIVFFGTSEFAIPSLEALLGSKHRVTAVVTQPDSKKGRSLKLLPSPIKVAAAAKGITIYQPTDASSSGFAAELGKLKADLFVVISFGQILKSNILKIPAIFSVNVHGSLLPKYRGAAPTNHAIINGEPATGVTVMKLNEKMDEGDIIVKEEIPIDNEDTNITLTEKLSKLGASVLMKAIGLIEAKDKTTYLTKQDPSLATYAPKLKKLDGLINWKEPADMIHRKVRGLLPWPGAYTRYEGKTFKILKTSIERPSRSNAAAGEVVAASALEGICVNTGSGVIAIKYLKPEGKKAMDSGSFLLGYRIKPGYRFE